MWHWMALLGSATPAMGSTPSWLNIQGLGECDMHVTSACSFLDVCWLQEFDTWMSSCSWDSSITLSEQILPQLFIPFNQFLIPFSLPEPSSQPMERVMSIAMQNIIMDPWKHKILILVAKAKTIYPKAFYAPQIQPLQSIPSHDLECFRPSRTYTSSGVVGVVPSIQVFDLDNIVQLEVLDAGMSF